MKRILSALLSFCIFLTVFNTSVNATELEESESLSKHIKVNHVGHGEYLISNEKGEKATLIDGEMVYVLKNGTYLAYANDTKLLLVEKIILQLNDPEKIETTFNSYNISEEIKKEIREMSKLAIDTGNTKALATLYTAANVPQEPGTIGTMAQITSYYTYSGRNLRQDMIYFYNMSTTWVTVSSGSNTKQVAEGLFNFGILAAGAFTSGWVATGVALFSGAISAFQTFINMTGYTPVGGSTSDTIQVKIDYDKWTKYDYVQDCTGCQGATYILGSVTQSVRIIEIDNYMYFFTSTGGKSTSFTTIKNQTYKTPNYSVPAPKAIQYYGNPWTEYVKFEVYNKSVAF